MSSLDETAGSLADYDFDLPREQIAQAPPPERGDSRLLVLHRSEGRSEHRHFRDLGESLRCGDLLVLNETRVFPARLRMRRTSGAQGELLLLEADADTGRWSAIGHPGSALKAGQVLVVDGSAITAHPVGRDGELVHVEFRDRGVPLERDAVLNLCEHVGEVPLPPYIARERGDERFVTDRRRYQTVFARHPGSAAAPTAGLHFTRERLRDLRERGVALAHVTLHIGLGTFKPLTEATFGQTTLYREKVDVSTEALEAIHTARLEGRRILAVGTTSARVLESLGEEFDPKTPYRGSTDLFIKPGYAFKTVTGLLTNFHLPRSSLLLLVCALAGRDFVLRAYRDAVREGYRFYSYGDAMLVL